MRRFRVVHGITTGVVAAAATTGALVGFGLRFGTPARPFNALAAMVLGVRAQGVWRFALVPTMVGLVVHIAIMTLWGVLFVVLVDTSGDHAMWWGILLSAVAFALSWLAAIVLGVGLATLLPVGDRIVLFIVLAAALPLGMRFALSLVRAG